MSGKYEIVRGSLYKPETETLHEVGDVVTLNDREAEFLGSKVQRKFSPKAFLEQNVGPISEAIYNGERDEYLRELEKIERENKERKTVLDAIDSRQDE